MRLPLFSLSNLLLNFRIASFGLLLSLAACEPETVEPPIDGEGEDLHFSFVTPDWERKIDCAGLDLPPFELNDDTYFTFATLNSTKSTFYLSYPKDSSDIVKAANLNKYSIKEYGKNEEAFQFSLKLPLKEESSQRLISQEGLSATSYNEIISIEYDGIAENEAVFKIKGKYEMATHETKDPAIKKTVSGTYHLKIRTSRN